MNFKKILVAVDASENSARAVEYVQTIVGAAPDFFVTLFSVVRPPERDLSPDEASWEKRCREEEGKIRDFLDDARKSMEASGLTSGRVEMRMAKAEGSSIAHSILKVQREGGFGTVVVGRRGVSKAEEFLFGSVSSKIVHYARDCTVWVVE